MLLKDNIPFSYVFGKIKKELVFITMYVVAIYVVQVYFKFDVSIPISVPMILGTVISLLLAFRANQAYDRWWEARTVWGGIVNDSRSFARQIISFIDSAFENDEKAEFESRVVNRQIAWAYCLGRSLRGHKNVKQLSEWISNDDNDFIRRFDNAPMALLELQAREIKYALDCGWINPYQHVALDEMLSKFSEHMGKCERIKKTIFPATYGLYLHMSMNLFITLLPFSLIGIFGWVMMPLVIAISAAFWLIEKMSVHLQDPFENKPTDTPMTAIAQTIERDLKQVLRQQYHVNAPHQNEPKRKEAYYVL